MTVLGGCWVLSWLAFVASVGASHEQLAGKNEVIAAVKSPGPGRRVRLRRDVLRREGLGDADRSAAPAALAKSKTRRHTPTPQEAHTSERAAVISSVPHDAAALRYRWRGLPPPGQHSEVPEETEKVQDDDDATEEPCRSEEERIAAETLAARAGGLAAVDLASVAMSITAGSDSRRDGEARAAQAAARGAARIDGVETPGSGGLGQGLASNATVEGSVVPPFIHAEGEAAGPEEEAALEDLKKRAEPMPPDFFGGRRRGSQQVLPAAMILRNGGDSTAWHAAGMHRVASEDFGAPGCLLQWMADELKLELCLTYEHLKRKDRVFFSKCTAAFNQRWLFEDGCLRVKSDYQCLGGNASQVDVLPPSRSDYLANFIVAPGLVVRKQQGAPPRMKPQQGAAAALTSKATVSPKPVGNKRASESWSSQCLAHDALDSGHRVVFQDCDATPHQQFTWSCR
eukprot:TRINITY_DN19749_c0_g1_i1.p1 TRINITY_DN19749_c0_g1~~TRINITY_DN19749_c0_g1_i1.p1  ORF type:complete len:456 (+),score=101.14 TRINITY_DN19749_c0_g1_i1:193-1560(+)